MPALRPLLIAALLLTLGAALPAPRAAYAADVVGLGTSASCIEAELVAKLSGGGSITFNSITIADPQLGALADNGGGTSTMALPNASPAVGAGSNATCPATDQRGVARPQGARCDIGAFELVLALALSPSFAGAGEPGFIR